MAQIAPSPQLAPSPSHGSHGSIGSLQGARNMPCKLGAASKKAPYSESAAPSRRSKTLTWGTRSCTTLLTPNNFGL